MNDLKPDGILSVSRCIIGTRVEIMYAVETKSLSKNISTVLAFYIPPSLQGLTMRDRNSETY